MILNGNKLRGSVDLAYKIEPYQDGEARSLFLKVYISNKWQEVDCVSDYLHKHENEKQCYRSLIRDAEKKWNIKLIKDELTNRV